MLTSLAQQTHVIGPDLRTEEAPPLEHGCSRLWLYRRTIYNKTTHLSTITKHMVCPHTLTCLVNMQLEPHNAHHADIYLLYCIPTHTLTGGMPSTPSLLLAVQQGVLDCRVHQPQASYLYQPIIVFCQYSVSHGVVHSSYYTIQYILE